MLLALLRVEYGVVVLTLQEGAALLGVAWELELQLAQLVVPLLAWVVSLSRFTVAG